VQATTTDLGLVQRRQHVAYSGLGFSDELASEDGTNTVLGGAFSDTKKEIFHLGSVNWW
jgi:hypothetical protein